MPLPSDGVRGQDWLVRRIADLERKVEELSAARRLEASRIGAGGLTIADGGELEVLHINGIPMLEVGPGFTADGTPIEQVLMRRPSGSAAFWLWGYDTSPAGLGFIAFLDRQQNIVIADEPAGRGLSKPYFPCGQFVSMSVPTDSTSGGTFVELQKAFWRWQHWNLRVWVLAQVTSTTAEIRFKINTGPDAGTVLHGPVTLNNGFGYAPYEFAVPGEHLSEFEISLEGRVASGAGAVAVRVIHTIGKQA